MECVATDMKAMGMYLSRTLSYNLATFEIVKLEHDPNFVDYEGAARLFEEIKVTVMEWIRMATSLEPKQRTSVLRQFWGSAVRLNLNVSSGQVRTNGTHISSLLSNGSSRG